MMPIDITEKGIENLIVGGMLANDWPPGDAKQTTV
jgi:hypothetical protein